MINAGEKRPIGMIGNTNFFSSYILATFWIGIYILIEMEGGLGLGGFDIYKTKLIAKNVWLPAESVDGLNTEFNVWFMSSKTKEAVFKIIINK